MFLLLLGHEVAHDILKHRPMVSPLLPDHFICEFAKKCQNCQFEEMLCSQEYFETYIKREFEADQKGMIMARNACYDIFETPNFFKNEMKLLEPNAVKELTARLVQIEEFLSMLKLEDQTCIRTNLCRTSIFFRRIGIMC